MRNKTAIVSLMYAASVSTFAHPVFAADSLEGAQTRLKVLEAVKAQHPWVYANALFHLAEAYYANKEDERAEDTFRQCLPFYFASNPTYREGACAAALLNWSVVLLNGNGSPIDKTKIDSLVLEGLEQIDKVPDKLSRAQTYQSAILMFTKTGNVKEEQRCIKFLLDACSECEANENADLVQTRRAVTNLSWVAQRIFPFTIGAIRQKPLTRDELVKRGFDEEKFEIAEKLILRAIKLCDRTNKLNRENAWQQRLLARWYAVQGKLDLANEHEQLATKLTPPEDLKVRGGCGRTTGKVTGAGVIAGACGMG